MTAPVTVEGLTKRYGAVHALDDLSFEVPAGTVTGFLGPNGAGKSTTLRILLGLVRATSGRALVDGRDYAALAEPVRQAGAALEATGHHPGRTAAAHLRALARAGGLPDRRVGEVLGLVELEHAAGRRVGGFSLGMRQRLSLAAALLGEPHLLILDEPTNGLDPEGIRWLRDLVRHHADDGGTVLVSSHQLAELGSVADHVVIIHRGRLAAHGRTADLADRPGGLEAAFLELTST